MSQWGTSDSGILRKNKVEENLDELLVFGYSCKIFRDDEKAIYVDQGKHLIPWMGDETLKIDRYDGRGALSDLRQYEASREGYDVLRWMGLSESEKKLEELCDSERYYALEINEEEEEMYKEEVAKRKKTTAIAFNYENPTGESTEDAPKEGIPTVPEKEEEDEPYKPSPILDVPININIPQTVKVYARIEKTALFVCRQGPQMEILIKAKQADNPQFSFLTVNDPLYKFYRHVYSAFKNGRYQPQCEKKPEEPEPPQHQDDDHDSHYLHPSLLSASAKSVGASEFTRFISNGLLFFVVLRLLQVTITQNKTGKKTAGDRQSLCVCCGFFSLEPLKEESLNVLDKSNPRPLKEESLNILDKCDPRPLTEESLNILDKFDPRPLKEELFWINLNLDL